MSKVLQYSVKIKWAMIASLWRDFMSLRCLAISCNNGSRLTLLIEGTYFNCVRLSFWFRFTYRRAALAINLTATRTGVTFQSANTTNAKERLPGTMRGSIKEWRPTWARNLSDWYRVHSTRTTKCIDIQ